MSICPGAALNCTISSAVRLKESLALSQVNSESHTTKYVLIRTSKTQTKTMNSCHILYFLIYNSFVFFTEKLVQPDPKSRSKMIQDMKDAIEEMEELVSVTQHDWVRVYISVHYL